MHPHLYKGPQKSQHLHSDHFNSFSTHQPTPKKEDITCSPVPHPKKNRTSRNQCLEIGDELLSYLSADGICMGMDWLGFLEPGRSRQLGSPALDTSSSKSKVQSSKKSTWRWQRHCSKKKTMKHMAQWQSMRQFRWGAQLPNASPISRSDTACTFEDHESLTTTN